MATKKLSTEERVLAEAVKYWTSHETGTDSLRIASVLKLDNETVKQAMLNLEASGKATLNKNAPLSSMTMGKSGFEFGDPVLCHVIFPSKEVLTENFHASGMGRQDLAVYDERVMKGSHTYSFVYFHEEVLRKYVTRPDLYDVSDTVSGGHINYEGDDDALYIYIRHGRRKLTSGRSSISVFLTDLQKLSKAEQRYWHGFEIANPTFAKDDEGFAKFLDVNLEGDWITYDAPIKQAVASIKEANEKLGVPIFRNTDNDLLHAPVENTEKSFSDSCSELHKLVGNDSLNKSALEAYLVEKFGAMREELVNKGPDKRPLSGVQLMNLIETKVGMEPRLTKAIKALGEDRGKTAHALNFSGDPNTIYLDIFYKHCRTISESLEYFVTNVEAKVSLTVNKSTS